MSIGLKIKRLRLDNGLTQEELGDMLGLSSKAISRWENSSTYPDITLLPIIANIFKVTTDELLEVDELKTKEDVYKILKKVEELGNDYNQALIILKEAKKRYPNNYEILDKFLFYLMGGIADNNNKVLTDNKDEINKVCNIIINGCTDERIRLQAFNYKAKVLFALGDEVGALSILKEFPSFYHSSNQKIEQLYPKGDKRFYKQLISNIDELCWFIGNKLGKAVCYNENLSHEEMLNKCEKMFKLVSECNNDEDLMFINIIAKSFFGEMINRGKQINLSREMLNKISSYNLNLKSGH